MIDKKYNEYFSLFEQYGDISLQKERFGLNDNQVSIISLLYIAYKNGILKQTIASYGIVPRIKEYFTGNIDELINRINSNSNLSSIECIFIPNEISRIEDLEKLRNTYSDKEIVVKWNNEIAFIDDAISAVYMINYFKSIMSDELSPLERITIAYDIVKSHYYKEKNIKNTMSSRYITNMVNNDYIVCSGYVNIFNRLIEEAGMEVYKLSLSMKIGDSIIGHVRSVVHVVDDKYGLNCYCVFDPTFDSADKNKYYYIVEDDSISISEKKEEGYQETDSLCLYKHFLVPLYLYEVKFPNSFDEKLSSRRNKNGNKEVANAVLHNKQLKEGSPLPIMKFVELLYNVKLAEGYKEEDIPILINQSFIMSNNKRYTNSSLIEAISEIKSKKDNMLISD